MHCKNWCLKIEVLNVWLGDCLSLNDNYILTPILPAELYANIICMKVNSLLTGADVIRYVCTLL